MARSVTKVFWWKNVALCNDMQQIEAYGRYSILQPFYKALGILL
jgi:hypothetical protein